MTYSKKIDPFLGLLDTMQQALNGLLNGDQPLPHRVDALTDDLSGQTVDTCCPTDTETWETAVCRDDHWIIVEQYPDRAAAVDGHSAWAERLKADPAMALTNVSIWEGIDDE